MKKDTFNVGIYVKSNHIMNWAYQMLLQLYETNVIDSIIFIINPDKSRTETTPSLKFLLYDLYSTLEKYKFKTNPNASELRAINSFEFNAKYTEVNFEHNPNVITALIESEKLDFIVNLSLEELPQNLYSLCKAGIWQFQHFNEQNLKSDVPGFWEVFNNYPAIGCHLGLQTSELENPLIVAKSTSSTEAISVNRNKNNIYWKT